jgi:hypothetical protein
LDAGFTAEVRPQILFKKVASTAFTAGDVAPGLLAKSPAQLVLFRSEDGVLRQENGRGNIQLKKNGEALITHLPQPLPSQPHSDVIVRISK